MSLRVPEVVRDPAGADPQTLEGQSIPSVIPEYPSGIQKKTKRKYWIATSTRNDMA